MQNKDKAATLVDTANRLALADEAELTAKELAQERKAAIEEQERKAWLRSSPAQLAGRIPVSVFDLGNHLGKA